jgi:SAM-dependent methyltransferase
MTDIDTLAVQASLEEYAHPELYDLENQPFEPDGPFSLALAQQLQGPVLELGCGTGRVTIPLAQNGVDITGLDLVPAMLERAKLKAGGLAIRWVAADARCYHLEQADGTRSHFRMIFEIGSVFQHMLAQADQEAFLARVHEHLEDDGRFVMSLFFPHPDMLTDVQAEQPWFSYENLAGQEVSVSGTEAYDPLRQVKLETAYRRWEDASGQEIVHVAPLSLRYVFPQEMETLLHYNGFRVLERYGDWDGSPLSKESRLMIYVCAKRYNPL